MKVKNIANDLIYTKKFVLTFDFYYKIHIILIGFLFVENLGT